MTSRNWTVLGLAAGLALGLAALQPEPSQAQEQRTLSVITSAVYKKSFDEYIVPKMMELYNVEVVSSPFLSAEALARAVAQRGNPQISVFMLDEGPWQQGKSAGLWAELNPERIPNMLNVPEEYRDPDGTGVAMMLILLGLMYDAQALEEAGVEPPVSLLDMWKEDFEDRVSIQQFSSTFAFALLARTDQVMGGDGESFDAGFEKLAELRPNVRVFSGPAAQLIQLFQEDEIWLAWGGHFTAMQATAAGTPVTWTAPSEGAMGYAHYIAIAEGAPNREDAERLVNLILSPEYQKIMAQTDFMAPANTETELDADFAATFPVTAEAMAAATPIPWQAYETHRIRLNERWQREIER